MTTSDLVVVDSLNDAGSFDLRDTHGRRVGHIDLVTTPSGLRLWNKSDAQGNKLLEGICTPEETQMEEGRLVITIWVAK